MKLDLSENFVNKLLSAVVYSKEFVSHIRGALTPDHFLSSEQWIICKLAYDYFDKYHDAIGEQLKDELQKYARQVKMSVENGAVLLEVAGRLRPQSESEIAYVKDEVTRTIKHQDIRLALEEFLPKYQSGVYEIEELASKIDKIIRKVSLNGNGTSDLASNQFHRRMDYAQQSDLGTVSTMITPLDKRFHGIEPGQLGTIMAPSGVGKTFFMTHLGRAAMMQGCSVFHYSLEMTQREILRRYDQMISGATEAEMFLPEVIRRTKRQMEMLTASGAYLKVFYMGFFDNNGESKGSKVEQLFRDFRHNANKYGKPGMLLVDYGDLLAKDGKSRYEEQGVVWRALKAFAVEQNICVWVATQSARSGVGVKRMTELEVGDSYEKVRISDIFIGFNRNILYDRKKHEWVEKDTEHNENIVRLFVIKHRGRADKYDVEFACDLDRAMFFSPSKTLMHQMGGEPMGTRWSERGEAYLKRD